MCKEMLKRLINCELPAYCERENDERDVPDRPIDRRPLPVCYASRFRHISVPFPPPHACQFSHRMLSPPPQT